MNKLLSVIITGTILISLSSVVKANENYTVNRLYGSDRYKTSLSIAKNFTKEKLKNVIVTSGRDFPDALTGSILSKKYNAPIILLNNSFNESIDTVNYIANNLDKSGTIFILGGTASVKNDFIENMKKQGFYNIERLGGVNRAATNKLIVDRMSVKKGTPIVVTNGYDGFADALSISSVAASKEFPILITNKLNLPDEIKSTISTIEPTKVYVIGGSGSVSQQVLSEIKKLVPTLKDEDIVRIAGINRYETSFKIFEEFNLDTDTVVIANGENFPDALSGTAIAAKFNAPILLTNGKDIDMQKQLIDSKNFLKVFMLGGIASVDFPIEYQLKGYFKLTEEESHYIGALLTYCDEYIDILEGAKSALNQISNDINRNQGFLSKNNLLIAIDASSNFTGGFYGYLRFWENYNNYFPSIVYKFSTLKSPEITESITRQLIEMSQQDNNNYNTAGKAYGKYMDSARSLSKHPYRGEDIFTLKMFNASKTEMTKSANEFNSSSKKVGNRIMELRKLRERIAKARKYTI